MGKEQDTSRLPIWEVAQHDHRVADQILVEGRRRSLLVVCFGRVIMGGAERSISELFALF